jgi:hypothetical protein
MKTVYQYSFYDIPFEQIRVSDCFGSDKVEEIWIKSWFDRHFLNNIPAGYATGDLSGKFGGQTSYPPG